MKAKHLFHGWNLEREEKFLRTPVGIFLLGAFLGELSPDPTDAIHFWLQNHVLNNPAISPAFKAGLEVFDWYFMSASYFLLLLILAYFLHIRRVSIVKRLTIVGGIISIGVVIGILAQLLAS
jgi:amino acid transporter